MRNTRVWILAMMLGLLVGLTVNAVKAQDSLKQLYIPIPTVVCGNSDEVRQAFQQKVSDAIARVESLYAAPQATVNVEQLKYQALQEAGLSPSEAAALEEMSEVEQEAAAMKMAQDVMAGALSAPNQADMNNLLKQMEVTSQMLTDITTIDNLLGTIFKEFLITQNEAGAWHDEHLKPLYDSLKILDGEHYEQMKKRIMAAEKTYCSIFSSRNLALIQKEVKALEQSAPTIKRLYQVNATAGAGGASTHNIDTDPVWLYLKAIEKSYDYWMDETRLNFGN